MRAVILFCVCGLMLAVAGCGRSAPPVALELHDGNALQASDWQGKWVYINYWAEWCKPCAEEMPELNAFARAEKDVVVLGVSYDKVTDPVLLMKQIHALRMEFQVVTNDIQAAFPHPLPDALPTTIVVNPEGRIHATLTGPQTVATLKAAMQ